METTLRYVSFHSSLGWLLVAARPEKICMVLFAGPQEPSDDRAGQILRKEFPGADVERDPFSPLLAEARKAISEYLTDGIPIPSLPLDTGRGTAFQRQVWEAIGEIPFGETRTYLDIARTVGRPSASRAVGGACGANPLPIVIPCHRVVGSGGKLGGYSGGISIKETLLQMETPRNGPS